MVILQIGKTNIELSELDSWTESTLTEYSYLIKRKIERINAPTKRLKVFGDLAKNNFVVLNAINEIIFKPSTSMSVLKNTIEEFFYEDLNLLELCELNDKLTVQIELVNYQISLRLDEIETQDN